MANILLTGSIGFIGYHLSTLLLENNHSVVGIDNGLIDENISFKNLRLDELCTKEKYTHFEYSIHEEQNKLLELLQDHRIDLIIHLAAKTGVRDSELYADSYFSSNILASKSMFSLCANYNIPIIYASSSSVYGDHKATNFSEDLKIQTPQSIYALSKIATENLGYYYAQKYNLNTVGLRFFTVYGPLPRKDMALWKFLEKIDNHQPITVYGDGEMIRDFTYVDDITEGILKTINLMLNGQFFKNEIFNLGYGNGRKVLEMIKILENHLGKKAIIQFEKKSYEDMSSTMANITKANQTLGFNPKYSLEEGIENTMDWYLQKIRN